MENCEGDVDNFATVKGPADTTTVGDVLAKRDDTDEKLSRDFDIVAESAQRLTLMNLATGDFD